MEDYGLVEKQKCIGDEGRLRERLKMEAQVVISQQGGDVGHAHGDVGRAT